MYKIPPGGERSIASWRSIYEYKKSRSFIDLGPTSLRFNIFKFHFPRNCFADWSQILCGAFVGWRNESLIKWFKWHEWPPCPYMLKTWKKSSSLEPKGRWSWKLVCGIVQVTWPRWPPCPYMLKSFKNLLLWNLKADDLETWYAASRTRVHANKFVQMMPQDVPWPIFRQDQIWSCMLLCSRKLKHWIFQKLL